MSHSRTHATTDNNNFICVYRELFPALNKGGGGRCFKQLLRFFCFLFICEAVTAKITEMEIF